MFVLFVMFDFSCFVITLKYTQGYFVEILSTSWLCFGAANYGSLLIVDPERELAKPEIDKLVNDIESNGLGLVLFSDWYDRRVLPKLGFTDDNTHTWWDAITGG